MLKIIIVIALNLIENLWQRSKLVENNRGVSKLAFNTLTCDYTTKKLAKL